MSSEKIPEIHYSDSLDKLFKKSGENFLCLRWAQEESQRWTAQMNTYFTIPTIILSGLTGIGSVGSDTLLPFTGASTLIGLLSFVCATLQTIASYFAFAKRSEAHRIGAIQYAKMYQIISFELSRPRNERMSANKLMDLIKSESDRLLEISPQIPRHIIDAFREKFKEDYTKISVPLVLNGLEPIEVVHVEIPLTQTQQQQQPQPSEEKVESKKPKPFR
jgi:hypothetical protein